MNLDDSEQAVSQLFSLAAEALHANLVNDAELFYQQWLEQYDSVTNRFSAAEVLAQVLDFVEHELVYLAEPIGDLKKQLEAYQRLAENGPDDAMDELHWEIEVSPQLLQDRQDIVRRTVSLFATRQLPAK